MKTMLDKHVKNPHKPRLTSTEQVVSVIKELQKDSNDSHAKQRPFVNTYQILLEIPDMPEE